MNFLITHLRNKLLAGLFAVIPIAIVVFIAIWVNDHTKALAKPLGVEIPGLGVLIAIAGIYLFGLLVTSVVGQFVLGWMNVLLLKVPGLNLVYRAWKDILVTPPDKTGMFDKSVLVPAGFNELQLGFTNGVSLPNDPERLCVLLPNIPSPFSGRIIIVRRDVCTFLNMSVEEAMKYQLSTGNYLPEGLRVSDKTV